METLFDLVNPKIVDDIHEDQVNHRLNRNESVRVVHVPVVSIVDHPDNKKMYLDIEDEQCFQNLKQDILENGIIHIPVCKKHNGEYVLVDGHRRISVVRALINEGYSQFDSIDIKLIHFDHRFDELEYMLSANVKVRKPSDYSRMMQISAYSQIYDYRRENNEVSKEVTRSSFVAKQMLMGERQVNKFLYIRNRFSDDDIKALLSDSRNSINAFYSSLKAKGDEYELQFEHKPGLRIKSNKKHDKTINLTQKQRQTVLKYTSDMTKLIDASEQVLAIINGDKDLSIKIKRLSKSLQTTIDYLNTQVLTDNL